MRSRGFTLVEVLVAMVVFAFGLLGAAGLQMASLKSSQQANNQAIASAAIREFSDLMLSYPDSVFSSLITTTVSLPSGATVTNPYHVIDYTSEQIAALNSGPSASKCFNTECNTPGKPGELGEAAIRDWLNRLNASLPQVRVKVCLDSSPTGDDGVYRWECNGQGKLTAIKLRWALKEKASVSGDSGSELFGKKADDSLETERAPMVAVQVVGTVEDSFNDLK